MKTKTLKQIYEQSIRISDMMLEANNGLISGTRYEARFWRKAAVRDRYTRNIWAYLTANNVARSEMSTTPVSATVYAKY